MSIKSVMRLVVRAGMRCPWRLDYRPEGSRGQRCGSNFRPRKQQRSTYEPGTRSRGEYIAPAKVPTFKAAAELWYASKLDRRPAHVADLRSRLDRRFCRASEHQTGPDQRGTIEKCAMRWSREVCAADD